MIIRGAHVFAPYQRLGRGTARSPSPSQPAGPLFRDDADHSGERTPAWCRDQLVGAEELSGVGERPLSPCPAPGSRSCPSSSTRSAVTIFRDSSARSQTGRPTTPACASVEV